MDSEERKVLSDVEKKFGKFDVLINLFTMQLVWASARFSKALGYAEGEIVGRSMRDVFTISTAEVFSEVARALSRKHEVEKVLKGKAGNSVRFSGVMDHVMVHGEPYIFLRIKKHSPAN